MSDEMRDATVRLSADVDPYKRSVAQANEETTKLADAVDKLSAKLDGLTKKAGKKLLLFGAAGAAGVTALTTEAALFEKKLSVLNATAEITDTRFKDVTKTVRGLSKDFPVTRNEAIGLVTALDKLGVQAPKAMRSVSESMIKLSAASGENLIGLTTSMVELQKQLGTLNTGTMDVFANSLLSVSKTAGVSATGVVQFAQAIAPAARAAQMSQASVIGVSAAFTKAGADGYAAASTFSTMLADITRQIATGSPEIAKYSNLLGVTSEQFATMDKGAALAGIFEEINRQGPDAIRTLDRLGYDGVRALKSIQAVSQSGGLRDAIAQATGAYSSTDALDRGSKVAMDGLTDELGLMRNRMQDITTQAGTPFLLFFTKLADVLNDVMGPLVPLAGAIAEVSAGLGAMLSLGAGALGTAMVVNKVSNLASGIGTLSLGPGSLLRAGSQAGKAVAGGSLPADGTPAYKALDAYTGGQMRWWQRASFMMGSGWGQAMGPDGGPGFMQRFGGPVLTSPLKLGRIFAEGTRDFHDQAWKPWDQRKAPILGGLGNIGSAMLHPMRFLAGWRSGEHSNITGPAGMARDPEDFAKAVRKGTGAVHENIKAQTAHMSVTKQASTSLGALARAYGSMQLSSLGSLARGGAHLGGAALMGLGRSAISLLGPAPLLTLAGGAGALLYSRRDQGKVEPGTSAPIDKYNAALGIATSELGSFTTAVQNATAALPSATRLSDAKTVPTEVGELARVPGRELTNDLFGSLKYGSSRAAMMQLMGITDPRQLMLIQADIEQARGNRQAQRATDIFFGRTEAGRGVDYQALVREINAEQGQGFWGHLGKADPTGAKITGAIFDSLRAQHGANAVQFNTKYADQVQGQELARFLGEALPQGYYFTKDQKKTAFQAVQGLEDTFFGGERTGFDVGRFAIETRGMSDKEQGEYFFTDFLGKNKNSKVAGYIQDLMDRGVDFGGMTMSSLEQLKRQEDSAYNRRLKESAGRLGFASLAESGSIQQAVRNPGDLNMQYQGVQSMLRIAQDMGGGFAGTDAALQKIKDAAESSSEELYKMAAAAQGLNAARRADAMHYMGRVGRIGSSVANFRSVMREDPGTEGHMEREEAARQELTSQKEGYYDYMVSIIQAHKNFAIQMRRAEEQRNLALERTNEDFYRSMQHAAADFHRSRARQERDFNISMERQAEDAAKGMYDAFARVRLEYTMSAAGAIANMTDQNAMIFGQLKDLKALEKAGLSQSAIDVMDLANPAKAQQVARLVHDLKGDPSQVGDLNKLARQREKGAGALVQSRFSEQFRRQKEDFARGLADAETDFDIAQRRAHAAHGRMLDRMAEDWSIQVRQSQEDLARLNEQIHGNFGKVMEQAIRLIRRNLGDTAEKTIKELEKVKKAFPELFEDTYDPLLQGPNAGYAPRSPRNTEGRADVKNGRTISSAVRNRAEGATFQDYSTTFTGPMTVVADDPAKLAKRMEEQARIRRLTRPGAKN